MKEKEIELLRWVYYRLINVHQENKNLDFMAQFKSIIDKQAEENDKNYIRIPYMQRLIELSIKEIEATGQAEGVYFGLTNEEIKEYENLIKDYKE